MATTTGLPDQYQPTGVLLSLFGDPRFEIELYRAPDSGGSPGSWALLATLAAGTVSYEDVLPKTGTTYWYKARHIATGYDPGAYTSSVSTKATEMPADSPGLSAVSLALEYGQCLAEITASGATTVTVTVTASAFSGTPTVQLVGVTGSATLNTGPAIGVPSSSGQAWVFNRGALNAGAGQAQFRAVLSGTQSDDDLVTIEEQGRDTVPILARARVLTTTATQVIVRVAVADPYPQGAASGEITYHELGVTGTTPASGGTVTPAATLTEAAGTYVDYTIARPAFGTATGRVTFTAACSYRTSDSDAVDVPAQDLGDGIYRAKAIGSGQTVLHDTLTAMALDDEAYDVGGLHSNVTNNSRMTIPATGRVAGVWLLTARVIFAANATGYRYAEITKNGVLIGWTRRVVGATYGETLEVVAVDVDPSGGEYYDVRVYQNSGGNLDLAVTGCDFTATHLY